MAILEAIRAGSVRGLRHLLFGALLLSVVMPVAPVRAQGGAALTFAIVPQQSAMRLAEIWIPLLERLSQISNLDIRFATAKDIPTFEACLSKGAYDIAYMNPYHYITFQAISGYRAFAREKGKMLKGLIVVHRDSGARSLEDLAGMTIAFPSPAAFGASVIPRAELAARGIDFTPTYVVSHDSVYRAVAAGIVPAGGGILRTFNNLPPDIRTELKVIYETAEYTPHAFAAHPRVSDRDIAALADAMEQIGANEPALLEPIGMSGLQRAADADWNDVRALGLTRSDTDIVFEAADTCHSG